MTNISAEAPQGQSQGHFFVGNVNKKYFRVYAAGEVAVVVICSFFAFLMKRRAYPVYVRNNTLFEAKTGSPKQEHQSFQSQPQVSEEAFVYVTVQNWVRS